MSDIWSDRLRATLKSLLEEHRTDAASLSRQIGRSKDYIRDFMEGRKTSLPLQALVKIEKALSLEPGHLLAEEYPETTPETLVRVAEDIANQEARMTSEPSWPKYELRKDRLPIYSYRDALDGTLFVSRHVQYTIAKPSIVENAPDAYGVIVEGTVMSPAFDPGDTIIVNPNISFRIDADAIFLGHPGSEDLPESEFQRSALRRLVGYDDENWQVQELSPPRRTTLARAQWPRLSRIVGKFARP